MKTKDVLKEVRVNFDHVQEVAKAYDLSPALVTKLLQGDPRRLTYMWIKQGHVNYSTFQKLFNYIITYEGYTK
jgi:hypothetical protein